MGASARLPPRLDVYGGAIRVWWPGVDYDSDPLAHPLFLIHNRAGSDSTIAGIVETFQRRGVVAAAAPAARPEVGSDVPAVVNTVRSWGVELTLAGGEPAFAHRRELTTVEWLEPSAWSAPVRAWESGFSTDRLSGERVGVSLRPFEPDPWQRFTEQHQQGALVDGIVAELRNFGAFVEVYPGLSGLLHRSQISSEWVSHPEDFLRLGDRVVVRVVRVDAESGRIDLSLLDVPEDAEPERPAAVYPDGPPWLSPLAELTDAEPLEVSQPSVAPDELDAEPGLDRREREARSPTRCRRSRPAAEPTRLEAPARDEVADDGRLRRARATRADGGGRARAAETRRRAVHGTERRLRELRAEAVQTSQLLRRDLARRGSGSSSSPRARRRLSRARPRTSSPRLGPKPRSSGSGSLQRRPTAASSWTGCGKRGEIDEAERRTARLRGELRAEREASVRREQELDVLDPTGSRRFLADVRLAWERLTLGDDRRRFTWREPTLGPGFRRCWTPCKGSAANGWSK